MNTNKKSVKELGDVKVNVKIKLSAFWVTLMLFYIYADILGFYTPGVIENVISGEIGGVQITQGFLVAMAAWMAVPTMMVPLSLMLKARANRWVNVIAGVISFFALIATFFAGDFSIRYAIQAALEAVMIVLIVWHAWTWQ